MTSILGDHAFPVQRLVPGDQLAEPIAKHRVGGRLLGDRGELALAVLVAVFDLLGVSCLQ